MNNFTTTTDKKRKSLFGFSIKLKPFSSSTNNELLQRKRHNSVNYSNFAFSLNRDNEEIETIENERDGENFRSDSGNEFITHQENIGGELEPEENDRKTSKEIIINKVSVIRRQRAAAASTTRRFLPQGLTQLSRRPSVPTSSPLSIVGRLRKSFSTASLDEEDSAFCSAESSPSCSITSSSPESSPNKTINEKTPQIAFEWKWTELQKEKIEAELEHQCIHSFGHKLVKNPKLAFTNHSNSRQIMLGEMDNNVLCAEGCHSEKFQNVNFTKCQISKRPFTKTPIFQNVDFSKRVLFKTFTDKMPHLKMSNTQNLISSNVQFHLLSMIAPSNKKVVNIGSPSINDDNNNNNHHWFHLSPSFRPYSKNNLEISR
uniref:Uncharacterized protein n=1 Tax=Meloidogyne floridensis TaxID=298350 RepID=A0A915PB25_9BILA